MNAHNGSAYRLRAQILALKLRAPVCSDLVQIAQDASGPPRPSSLIYAPMIYRDPSTNSTAVTGLAALVFSWDSMLNRSLPASLAGMVVVLKGNTGAEASVASIVIEGGIARLLWLGARNEPPLPPRRESGRVLQTND